MSTKARILLAPKQTADGAGRAPASSRAPAGRLRALARRAAAICLAALPLAARAAPAAPVPDTIAQRVVACAACHMLKERNDQFFPRIAGKPAGYLYNQLRNFRDGRRTAPVMTYMVGQLSDDYLREIADYFAGLHPPPPPVQASGLPAAVLERGRLLATEGDAARKLPACVACHGAQLTGVAPAIPGLIGLPRDYVNAQFGAWRNQVRRAQAPDCMAQIATRLSPEDVNAVSGWLASQALTPEARPAATIARPLPLRCGSAPD